MCAKSLLDQLLSHVRFFVTPWITAHQASLSITNSKSLLKLMFIKSLMPSNHLILCRPLLLPPSVVPSITVFSKESALRIRWPKDWSFSFTISLSNEYLGLISFRMDWLDLLAVQGRERTDKSWGTLANSRQWSHRGSLGGILLRLLRLTLSAFYHSKLGIFALIFCPVICIFEWHQAYLHLINFKKLYEMHLKN